MRKEQEGELMRNKVATLDIICVCGEIVALVVSIILTCALNKLDIDSKLAIVSGGIIAPLMMIQISIIQAKIKHDTDVQALKEQVADLSGKVNEMSPVMEKVFLSDNDRLKRFAYRRYGKVCSVINKAIYNNYSDELGVDEYYSELTYLAELIKKDKQKNKKNFKGEIWAMTGFAEWEWIVDEGYERQWINTLTEMLDFSIPTRRICLVNNELFDIITSKKFDSVSANNSNTFSSFLSFLKLYYGDKKYACLDQYLIRETDNIELREQQGFFAIKLTNDDLHILYGETVNSKGALTAKLLFDVNEIGRVRKIYERYAKDNNKLENRLKELSKKNGLMDYLNSENIFM